MAIQEHFEMIRQGVETWNRWKNELNRVRLDLNEDGSIKPDLDTISFIKVDLSEADLSGADLREVDLDGANLREVDLGGANLVDARLFEADLYSANLREADLREADLSKANLKGANFSGADLSRSALYSADLRGADLREADLRGADLREADLRWADVSDAIVGDTIFDNVDLRLVKGLETIAHQGPSTIGTGTLLRSKGDIPEVFLRGAGLNDTFIEYIRSLTQRPIDFYSCFISYSSNDQDFAERLYADLQSNNVRCWFAPKDLKPGDFYRYQIEESIKVYDKLVLVLSQHSIKSKRVEEEVQQAWEREMQPGAPLVLFPIRVDDAVMRTERSWAAGLRSVRHIGDFTRWKEHDVYQQGLQRLLRDLKAENTRHGV